MVDFAVSGGVGSGVLDVVGGLGCSGMFVVVFDGVDSFAVPVEVSGAYGALGFVGGVFDVDIFGPSVVDARSGFGFFFVGFSVWVAVC